MGQGHGPGRGPWTRAGPRPNGPGPWAQARPGRAGPGPNPEAEGRLFPASADRSEGIFCVFLIKLGVAVWALPRGRFFLKIPESPPACPQGLFFPVSPPAFPQELFFPHKTHIWGGGGDGGGGRISRHSQTPSHRAGITYPVRVPPLAPINGVLFGDDFTEREARNKK